jgi:hypothetical protein
MFWGPSWKQKKLPLAELNRKGFYESHIDVLRNVLESLKIQTQDIDRHKAVATAQIL